MVCSSASTKIFNIGVPTRIIISIFPLGFQFLAPLAQLAEHRTLNPQVLGSSPRGRTPIAQLKISQVCETNQGEPSMTKSMESNTAAIYLRKSTEDDGKSVSGKD